jgi:transposase
MAQLTGQDPEDRHMCRTHNRKKYIVRLSATERRDLTKLTSTGKAAAHRITHARILLLADEGPQGSAWIDEDVAEAVDVTVRTAENIRKRFVTEGLEAAINRKKRIRPSRERLLDGKKEAQLVALCCSAPPEGRARWTLRLLADQLVALDIVDSISYETVRRTLKKTS